MVTFVDLLHFAGCLFNHSCHCKEGEHWDITGEQIVILFPILYISRYLLNRELKWSIPAEMVTIGQLASIPIACKDCEQK